MISKILAQSLSGIVPNRYAATITLTPDAPATPVTVNVYNAWLKPMDVRLSVYGGVNLQGDETLIKILDRELNPAVNGYEIRPRDTIAINGATYLVKSARLMTVRTVWECVCRKERS